MSVAPPTTQARIVSSGPVSIQEDHNANNSGKPLPHDWAGSVEPFTDHRLIGELRIDLNPLSQGVTEDCNFV